MGKTQFEIPSSENLNLRGTLYEPTGTKEYPILLIVPGFNGTYKERHIQLLAQALPKQKIGVLAFDFTHEINGESEGEFETLTLGTEFNDAVSVLDWFVNNHTTSAIHVLGHSLGAPIATAIAAMRPEVTSLITLTPVWDPEGEIPRLLHITMEEWRDQGYIEFEDNNPHNRSGQKRLNFTFAQSLSHFMPKELSAAITAPCLIIAGAEDTIVPISNAQTYFNHMVGEKKLSIVAGSDHVYSGKDAEDTVTHLITNWIHSF